MGYRPLDPGRRKWAKPVGYSVYTFDADARLWAQRYKAAGDGRVCTHETVPWVEEHATLVDFLAYAETWHSHRIGGEGKGRHVWAFRTELQIGL